MAKQSKSKSLTIQPLGDRVLVRPEMAENEKTASGIIIPDTAKQEKIQRGVVLAVGTGRTNDRGDLIPLRVKVGDKVLFKASDWSVDKEKIGDDECYFLSESSLIGIIK